MIDSFYLTLSQPIFYVITWIILIFVAIKRSNLYNRLPYRLKPHWLPILIGLIFALSVLRFFIEISGRWCSWMKQCWAGEIYNTVPPRLPWSRCGQICISKSFYLELFYGVLERIVITIGLIIAIYVICHLLYYSIHYIVSKFKSSFLNKN